MIFIYVLIIVLSLCCGLTISRNLKKKYLFYKSLVELLDSYIINVNFLQLSMRDFISNETKNKIELGVVEDILFAENTRELMCPIFLKKEEFDEVVDFICAMGQLNSESEIEKTEKARLVFSAKKDKCKLDYEKYGNASVKISILVGLLIVILML